MIRRTRFLLIQQPVISPENSCNGSVSPGRFICVDLINQRMMNNSSSLRVLTGCFRYTLLRLTSSSSAWRFTVMCLWPNSMSVLRSFTFEDFIRFFFEPVDFISQLPDFTLQLCYMLLLFFEFLFGC